MQTIQVLSAQEFQEQTTVLELLRTGQPFIVRGLSLAADLFEKTLTCLQRNPYYLFNILGNQAEGYGLRSYQEILEIIAELRQELAQDYRRCKQATYDLLKRFLIRSDLLNFHQAFSVQMDVLPQSELGQEIVIPASMSYIKSLNRSIQRVYLNTVMNISQTNLPLNPTLRKKNIHAHNYDTFTLFCRAGAQSEVYFFPPEAYRRFLTHLVTGGSGVLLLIPDQQALHDTVWSQAYHFEHLQAGDMVYTPPLWFHCFQHSGQYMNLANGEYFPELLSIRLSQIVPEIYGQDWQIIRTQTQILLEDAMRPAH